MSARCNAQRGANLPADRKQNVLEGISREVLGQSPRPQVRLPPPIVVVGDEEIRLSLALRPRESPRLTPCERGARDESAKENIARSR